MSGGLQFYALDTETTGLSAERNEIIELSIIRCSDRVQFTRQIKAWYPERASYDSLRITGRSYESLSFGIEKADIVKEANAFLNEDGTKPSARCIIGHNVNFDMRFLHKHWETFNQGFPAALWLDSKEMAKRELVKRGVSKPVLKLGACVEQFGLKKFEHMHSAKIDTRATYLLWKHLMDLNVQYIDLVKNIPHNVGLTEEEDMNELLDEEGNEIV